jgi:hypothetical protein
LGLEDEEKKDAEMIRAAIWLTGGTGILFLLLYRRTGRPAYAVIGQALIIGAFTIISVALLRLGQWPVGVAFGISALGQIFMMVRGQIRRVHARKENK